MRKNKRRDFSETSLHGQVREYALPREKLINFGVESLTDEELLAILLRTGTQGRNVLEVAGDLLKKFGSFSNLVTVRHCDEINVRGIGAVKAIELVAVLEIARRIYRSVNVGCKVVDPEDVAREVLSRKLLDSTESFFVLPLDKKLKLCGPISEVSLGTIDSSLVHPREVFNVAIRWSAVSIIVAHNHPSGDSTPSREDIDVTVRLIEAGKIMGIQVLDHVVVGKPNFQDDKLIPDFTSIRRENRNIF